MILGSVVFVQLLNGKKLRVGSVLRKDLQAGNRAGVNAPGVFLFLIVFTGTSATKFLL